MKTPSEPQLEALAKQLKTLSSVEPTVADGSITNAKLAKNAVKSDNIDWTTIRCGTLNIGDIPANKEANGTAVFSPLTNTSYRVLLGMEAIDEWYHLSPPSITNKQEGQFTIRVFNTSTAKATRVEISWLVIPV